MIGKREILDIAATTGLAPNIVEKDYVLGWMLAGIYAHPPLSETWVFKGGTCLKKCYFETYRFSEDLDFTVQQESHLHQSFLEPVFEEIAEWIYEQSGIEMPPDWQHFEVYDNPRGNRNCQGRITYRGPVSPSVAPQRLPRVRLDLTADERLVLPPVRRQIFHPYSDEPDGGIEVLTYGYEEAFGEKVRALAERTRPRDLYDVINLYRNEEARPSGPVLLDVLTQKCAYKGIPVPRAPDLEPFRDNLEGAWVSMLAHQLPALPPVESFWGLLPEFFTWLHGGQAPTVPVSFALAGGERIVRERTLNLPVGGGAKSGLEIIRFAAANRLCVDLDYQGSTRRIEPYSLRETTDGNIVLHAWNTERDQHRSYRVDRIQGARATGETFSPRYAIELTPSGPIAIEPTRRTAAPSIDAGASFARTQNTRARLGRRRPLSSSSSVPTYVYQCGMCGKKFRRRTQSNQLNPHKASDGFPCPGRTGWLIDTKY